MNMRPAQWIIATAVAAVIGLFYIHSFIFPRTEAQELINQVHRLEDVHRHDMDKLFKELRDLNQWLRENR